MWGHMGDEQKTSRRARPATAIAAFSRSIASAFIVGGFLGAASLVQPAQAAALLPANFFQRIPAAPEGKAALEADQLVYHPDSGEIVAKGDVSMRYQGYLVTADRLVFNQRTKELRLYGHVLIVDPYKTKYSADTAVITDSFKQALLNSLIMVTADGAKMTATSALKRPDGSRVLEHGTYAPCGDCIDSKGRRIGWSVRSQRMTQHGEDSSIELDEPILDVLGIPVMWLPWLRFPDPTDPRANGMRFPSTAMSDKTGLQVTLPYFQSLNRDMNFLFLPTLVSSQGLLMGTEFVHNVGTVGRYTVTVHGIYQLNPGMFDSGFGDTRLRGSIQTSGKFTPVEHWTAGWSYTRFTDPAFLNDYLINTGSSIVNEAYVQYLDPDTYADARVQEFVRLGEVTAAAQDQQARALPRLSLNHVQKLGNGAGQLALSGRLLGVDRAADATKSNALTFTTGYEEQKTHGMIQGLWSRQWIVGGAAITPYAGLRLDAAYYNGASSLDPSEQSLFAATPIAALDVRYPLMSVTGGVTQVIEPIAQLVYRGGDATEPGIINDDAQSFVFDDTNLFTLNHFSGSDRQDVGLRANLGARYSISFGNGAWLDLVGGQTFHLAGPNGLNTADSVYAGSGAGLDTTASALVAGLEGRAGIVSFGSKFVYDPYTNTVLRFSAMGSATLSRWRVGMDYTYFGPDPARGYTASQQDVGGFVAVPLADYWTARGTIGWDLTADALVGYGAALTYDDGYFSASASVSSTGPLVYDPDTLTFKLDFRLKGPKGTGLGG